VLSVVVIPGTVLFSPVFIVGKAFSIKKSREALAASTVKIQARDVMATWKLLTAIVVAPLTYFFWIVLFTYFRGFGYVPTWLPSNIFVLAQIIFYPTITYGSLRFGEIGMDIAKSLPPLIYLLVPSSSNTLTKLRKTRTDLANQVTDVINTLGPEMFPDFHSKRIITDAFGNDITPPVSPIDKDRQGDLSLDSSPTSSTSDDAPGGSSGFGNLPRNESFKDLDRMEFYSTRPATPTKPGSRTNSFGGGLGGFGLTPLSPSKKTVESEAGMAEVSARLKSGLRERSIRRRSSGADGWELGSGSRRGATTPGSEGGRKNM
jgi:glycerol-3-phosphate O-acyltransferase/dihydroxyacetone phosphate acyltransferase